MHFRKVQTQSEKIIDYQYIRNLKNRQVRKSRFKRTLSQTLFRFVLLTVLIGEFIYLSYYGFNVLQRSHLFQLTDIQIAGNRKTKVDEIQSLVLRSQKSALTADLTQIKLDLEHHPWIESAVVWRELPKTVHVQIVERKPVAMVLAGRLFLVDGSGRIIDSFDQNPEFSSLPVITGLTNPSDRARLRPALDCLKQLGADPEVMNFISELHYYDEYSTIIYLKGMPFGLLVSKDGILPMIQKFLSYSEYVLNHFGDQKIIDLRYNGQIILKDRYREQL